MCHTDGATDRVFGQHRRVPQDRIRKLTVHNDSVVVQVGGTDPGQLLASFGIELQTKYGEV